MAVCRGGIAFWVGAARCHGSRQTARQSWSLTQLLDPQGSGLSRGLSSASWALVPPNSLRYHSVKQPSLSHPFHHASRPERPPGPEDAWEHAVSVCVLVGPGEADGQHTLVEVPLFGQTGLGELLASGAGRPGEFLFPLTTVDGSREDDISVGRSRRGSGAMDGDSEGRERGSFRSLFEAEGCPAPYMFGSAFYCFHCPEMEPLRGFGAGPGSLPGCEARPGHSVPGQESRPVDLALLYGHAAREHGEPGDRPSEGEEKLALVYEKLRVELPNFFVKSHDYTLYSHDMEFLNGFLNTKSRGRVLYQTAVSLWRIACRVYLVDVRLEVLKLTKHMEDGSVKARWRLRGLPFHALLLRFYKKDKTCLYRSYDAFSTFYIGQDGLIHCHKVEKVMPAQPPALPRVGSLLAGALVALGFQDHRPALNLLPLLLASRRPGRN